MSKVKKKLRVFAGPNGSGKTTLFEEFSKNYNTGHFINADIIENTLKTKKFLNLDQFNLKVSDKDFQVFLEIPNAKSLLKKAAEEKRLKTLLDREATKKAKEEALKVNK